jgi:methionine sulfoxide reductase heme-binding subunit
MEFIILHSVRCALPFLVVAFVASSLATLWPSRGTRWLLSNRRYIGLAFAFGMAWHLTFVAYTFAAFGNQLTAMALVLDLIGVGFLIAMTATSFRWCSRYLSPVNWKRLHKVGIYAIWLLVTYIYFGSVRGSPDHLHEAGLAVLLAAWALRIVARASKWLQRPGGLVSHRPGS